MARDSLKDLQRLRDHKVKFDPTKGRDVLNEDIRKMVHKDGIFTSLIHKTSTPEQRAFSDAGVKHIIRGQEVALALLATLETAHVEQPLNIEELEAAIAGLFRVMTVCFDPVTTTTLQVKLRGLGSMTELLIGVRAIGDPTYGPTLEAFMKDSN